MVVVAACSRLGEWSGRRPSTCPPFPRKRRACTRAPAGPLTQPAARRYYYHVLKIISYPDPPTCSYDNIYSGTMDKDSVHVPHMYTFAQEGTQQGSARWCSLLRGPLHNIQYTIWMYKYHVYYVYVHIVHFLYYI